MKRGEINASIGKRGEEIAVLFLKGLKYQILERNFRCKGGEVDIIAKEGRTFVFVEVKTRRNLLYGVPQLAVTPFKQRQIAKAALTWLSQKRFLDFPARFDVVSILAEEAQVPVIDHIKNAFELAG